MFAFGLLCALRRLSNINIKTRVRVASLLTLAGIASLVFTDTDLKSFTKIIACSTPLAVILYCLVRTNKNRLNKTSKGIGALTVPPGFFVEMDLFVVYISRLLSGICCRIYNCVPCFLFRREILED